MKFALVLIAATLSPQEPTIAMNDPPEDWSESGLREYFAGWISARFPEVPESVKQVEVERLSRSFALEKVDSQRRLAVFRQLDNGAMQFSLHIWERVRKGMHKLFGEDATLEGILGLEKVESGYGYLLGSMCMRAENELHLPSLSELETKRIDEQVQKILRNANRDLMRRLHELEVPEHVRLAAWAEWDAKFEVQLRSAFGRPLTPGELESVFRVSRQWSHEMSVDSKLWEADSEKAVGSVAAFLFVTMGSSGDVKLPTSLANHISSISRSPIHDFSTMVFANSRRGFRWLKSTQEVMYGIYEDPVPESVPDAGAEEVEPEDEGERRSAERVEPIGPVGKRGVEWSPVKTGDALGSNQAQSNDRGIRSWKILLVGFALLAVVSVVLWSQKRRAAQVR